MISPAQKRAQQNRDTIFLEDGEVLALDAFPGDQFVQRIRAPRCAEAARAGNFVHLSCHDSLPMRRPLSIMRARDDWIEVLYKTGGVGLQLLSTRHPGDIVSVLGPIGMPFRPDPLRPNALLVGGGVGIPPMVFLADTLRHDAKLRTTAILGSEIPFPFPIVRSGLDVAGADPASRGTMPLLESWGVPARLASLAGYEGCFSGYVTELADAHLSRQSAAERKKTRMYGCGPTPMLKALADLAARHGIACDVSLEEYMACAVGGCAGCAVPIQTDEGLAMKRVCVDGPVFDAATVVW